MITKLRQLTEYIKKLQKIEKEYGNLTLCYSKDDEGNEYQEVHYEPTPCKLDTNTCKMYSDIPEGSITHVCIN